MISATPTPTTFDLAAASGFLLSKPTSTSRPGTSTVNTSDTTKTATPNLNSLSLSLPATSSPSSIAGSNTPPNSPAISSSSPQITGPPSPTILSSSSAISSISIMEGTSTMGGATPTNNSRESVRGHKLPIGAIMGVIIAICLMLVVAALPVWLRRRRRRQKNSYTNIVPTPYPILSADNSDAQTIIKVRQQFLRNELRAAQEQIIQIQNLQREASSQRGRAGSSLRLLSSRRAASTGSESRTAAILRLQERNEMLTARIRELEAGLQSPWALGLSDEPPPGYVE
ncbi:hypothetical protein K438DRAFT_712966 [Mycena galopus ATCC 62051]|nr:hypothetical protein K438DRAFT_712966 [Mycena galopus ATCC 62051]